MNKRITIVVPTYNEASNLQIIIPLIFRNVEKSFVIIVDDNSTDATNSVMKKLQLTYKNLIHLKRSAKLGRGTAVIFGFEHALKELQSDICIEMDADLSHDPRELPNLIKNSTPNTVVIASRYIKNSEIVDSPILRALLSKIANILNLLLFRLPIKDNTNGYRVYPKSAVRLLLKYNYKSTGFVTISESAYYLFRMGFKLKELPTRFVNRKLGGSKANAHEVLISLKDLLRIKFSTI